MRSEHATLIWNLTLFFLRVFRSNLELWERLKAHSSGPIVVSSQAAKPAETQKKSLTWIQSGKNRESFLSPPHQFNYGHIHMVTMIREEKKKLTVKFLTLNERTLQDGWREEKKTRRKSIRAGEISLVWPTTLTIKTKTRLEKISELHAHIIIVESCALQDSDGF